MLLHPDVGRDVTHCHTGNSCGDNKDTQNIVSSSPNLTWELPVVKTYIGRM